jgi:glycosyltransferase involved in cell wall biosynthesis
VKILINALSARQRGGQTYLMNVLAFLPRDGSVEVLLLAPASLELGYEHPYISRRAVSPALENPFVRAAWERLVLPRITRAYGADVLFCPGGVVTGAPRGCRTVTMFRNMIPFDDNARARYPFGYERVRNWLLHRAMLRSMLQADLVIFISEHAKQVIDRHAKGRCIRSVVIPHGIASQFRKPSGHAAANGAGYAGGYLLYVSYLDFYKAQLEVVRAYALLKRTHPATEKLLLVGPENSIYGDLVRMEVQRLGLNGDVVLTGPLPYADLPALYRGAKINIFASETENCPNILLEALATELPIVCSNRAPMPEFAGDAVVYFDPSSPEELAAKLAALLDDEQARAELSRRAAKRSQLYDWQHAARRTWEAITGLDRASAGVRAA